jgi:RNA polymerase sigma factor (sigma-70 family)
VKDIKDFDTLYRETVDSLSQYVFFRVHDRQDGEDILQQVYSDFYLYIISKGKAVDHPLSYLKSIADKHLAALYNKAAQPEETSVDHLSELLEDPEAEFEALVLDRALAELVWAQIEALPVIDQKILGGYFRFQLSYAEIAQEVHLSENAVKLRFHRAIKHLRDVCAEKLPDSE